MNFLKKLATPFVALWRWIKETAWVQPLLIVGIIFAIIFSIPSITTGIQSLIDSSEDDIVYFEAHSLSLEGSKQNERNSEADHFFSDFNAAQEAWTNNDVEEARNILSEYGSENRFFLFFVQSDCTGCSTLKDGLERLEDDWSTYITSSNGTVENVPSLTFQSIIVDSEFDDEYYEIENTKPINDLVTSPDFFEFYHI